MKRYGSMIKIKQDNFEKYQDLHSAVWPEVLATIKNCNIRNYSIYYKDGVMFSYFEYAGNDFNTDMGRMAADSKTQEWWSVVKPLMEPLETREAGDFWAEMEEVFHLD